MMKNISTRIKLMAEVQCWALWDMENSNNIDPSTIPISEALVNDLNNWSDRFDSIYELGDTNFHTSIGFKTTQDEHRFYDIGWALLEQLKKELPAFEFWYRDKRFEGLHREKPDSNYNLNGLS